MKKQLIIIGIFILLVSVQLSGCNETDNNKIDYEQKLVGIWNLTSGKLATIYQTLVFYPNKTARFGEINSSYPGGWSAYTDIHSWSVENGLLITFQRYHHFYLNWTIRFDGDTLILQNETMFPGGETRCEKIFLL